VTPALETAAERSAGQQVDRVERAESPTSSREAPRFGMVSSAAMLHLQRTAGNRAAGALAARTRPTPSSPDRVPSNGRPAAAPLTTDGEIVQRLGLGLLGDLVSGVGGLLGGSEAEELQQGGGAVTCSEEPSFASDAPVPVTINADTAVEFMQKTASALGNPHMAPSFSWDPSVDEKSGKVTKVNLTVTTNVIRPRYGMGRGSAEEIALIRKAEGLIKEHEQRHAAIAKDFARKAVCATLGKVGKAAQGALDAAMCKMNKAQEDLDKKEGMLTFTLNAEKTKVVDVGLGPFASASYPCT
jgi:hypothetical protein